MRKKRSPKHVAERVPKEHRKVQELEAAVARQQKDFTQQINALAASLS
jgi:hypothetical protein